MIKKGIKKIIGDKILGKIDFLRSKNVDYAWGGPFNGQKFRQKIFFDLLFLFNINAIIETGTHKGTTTELFASTSIPVFSTEIEDRKYSYSKMRFFIKKSNVKLYNLDSRIFLKKISENIDREKASFFYLDAHWKKDLPLKEEVNIIFSRWKKPIIMVDDFRVPNREYKYDDYGNGKVLEKRYIKDIIDRFDIDCFFPAVGPSKETGMKRGSVVLTRGSVSDKIRNEMNETLKKN